MDQRTKIFVKARSEAMVALGNIVETHDLTVAETTLLLLQVAIKWQDGVVHADRKIYNDTDNTLDHLEEKNA